MNCIPSEFHKSFIVHDLEFILSQSIWNNYFIKSNHSTIFNSELQSKGIKTVLI